jgi:hypothetical protein
VARDVQYDKHPLSLRRSCTEGTRKQILDDLMDWARNRSGPNIYWLCGMAGTGKTTIAYSFCKRLDVEHLLGASFFCSRTIDESRDIRAVFPAIARELALRSPSLLPFLIKAVKENPDIASGQPTDQLTRLIRDSIYLHLDKPCVVAFDAFDEFKTIEDARRLLIILLRFAPTLPNIRFFITSRQEPQLQEVLEVAKDNTLLLHEVEESLVRGDIKQYLVERRAEIRAEKRLSESWWTERQLQILLNSAGKLFIYASTACSFLETSDKEECEGNLNLVLSSHFLSSTAAPGQYYQLDKLYSQVLDSLKQDRRWHQIFHTLQVVIAAVNPLPIQTIAVLLKMDIGAVYTAVRRLGAVITIPDNKDANTPVLPFHASFPDFLHDQSRSNTHHIPQCSVHHLIMGLCLNVFETNPAFKQDICNIGKHNVHISSINASSLQSITKELEYSCIYWLRHLGHILDSEELQDAEHSQVMKFFDLHLLHWIECMALLRKLEDAVQLLRQLELSHRVSYF